MNRARNFWVEQRFALESFANFNFGEWHLALTRGFDKLVGVIGGVVGRGDEKAARVLNG